MKEPAFPQNIEKKEWDQSLEAYKPSHKYHDGLTKLEYASIQAMKGLLSNPSLPGWLRDENTTDVEELAIKRAKGLFTQLKREQ